jgi:hypothetical protein
MLPLSSSLMLVSFVVGDIAASEGATADTEVRGALEEYT